MSDLTGKHITYRLEYKPDIESMCSSNVPVHLHAVSESISTSGHGHSDGPRLRREVRSVSNTLYKFHPYYDTRTPSLVQKYQLSASERQDTKGADLRTEHGAKAAKLLGVLALPVCACVLLVVCSLASVPPVFVIRVCSCGCLLRCLAVLTLLLCPLALSPQFLKRLTGARPKNR